MSFAPFLVCVSLPICRRPHSHQTQASNNLSFVPYLSLSYCLSPSLLFFFSVVFAVNSSSFSYSYNPHPLKSISVTFLFIVPTWCSVLWSACSPSTSAIQARVLVTCDCKKTPSCDNKLFSFSRFILAVLYLSHILSTVFIPYTEFCLYLYTEICLYLYTEFCLYPVYWVLSLSVYWVLSLSPILSSVFIPYTVFCLYPVYWVLSLSVYCVLSLSHILCSVFICILWSVFLSRPMLVSSLFPLFSVQFPLCSIKQ